MINSLNLFVIFISLNCGGFLQNINATNTDLLTKETNHVLSLENIRREKYEINGTISFFPPNSPLQAKRVKITEIEYDGIEIKFVDKNYSFININKSKFRRIINGDLKPNNRDCYFQILSVVFKITAFIEEKCFHTTLWYGYLMDPMKISTSLRDQVFEAFHILEPNFYYKCIILPLDWFNNATYSNSGYSENRNIYDVNVLKSEQRPYLLDNLTIYKDSKTHNINNFIFDHIYSGLYTKIYYKTGDDRIIEEYSGKSTTQYDMNENILISYIKTNEPEDENNNNTIQNKNNLKN